MGTWLENLCTRPTSWEYYRDCYMSIISDCYSVYGEYDSLTWDTQDFSHEKEIYFDSEKRHPW